MVVYVIRSEDSQGAAAVDSTSQLQDNVAAVETSCKVGNFSHVQQHHFFLDQRNLDTASESCTSLHGRQIVTDQKPPPVMKKGKRHQRNVKSLFRETVDHHANGSGSLGFSDEISEVPQSAEVGRRKLRLPWTRKKKKNYKPGEETSRWRSNFESWKSSSQMSLQINIEATEATDRGLRRTASQSDLNNIDTVSVGWTDSDADSVSDDVVEGSVSDRGITVIL